MTTEDPVMDTLTARFTSLELQSQIGQCDPIGDADPPGRSLDSTSEGYTAEANANPPEPIKTNGTPRESSGSLPAARTEPGESEETTGGVVAPSRKEKPRTQSATWGGAPACSLLRGQKVTAPAQVRTRTGKIADRNTSNGEERTLNPTQQTPVTRYLRHGSKAWSL